MLKKIKTNTTSYLLYLICVPVKKKFLHPANFFHVRNLLRHMQGSHYLSLTMRKRAKHLHSEVKCVNYSSIGNLHN